MNGQRVMFTAPNVIEFQPYEFNLENLPADSIAIKSHYTLISPGTEMACLRGVESWAPPPFNPGYAGVGEIIGVGANVKDRKVGDMVVAYTSHASHVQTNRLHLPLPPGLDPKLAVFARMAAVSMTSLRVSTAEVGDYVAVTGLGLVGNLAAQLFTIAGCEVIGIDPSPARRDLALRCGIKHAVDSECGVAAVNDITGGEMCSTVVEATGFTPVVENVAQYAGKSGEVVLLGSPRGEYPCDLTSFVNRIHLSQHDVTFKGAHEWRYPTTKDPFVKHSLPRNLEILLKLVADGRLHVSELITHVLPPTEAEAGYTGLRDKKDEYLGVVFDWRGV